MDRYVGLDAHGSSCTVGVISPPRRRAYQRPWLGFHHGVYQRFTCVGLAALPSPLAARRSRLQVAPWKWKWG